MNESNVNVRLNIPTEYARKRLHICVLNEGAENWEASNAEVICERKWIIWRSNDWLWVCLQVVV